MNKFSCTCAGGFEGVTCQTGRSLSFRLQRHKYCSKDVSCGRRLSAISEHNLNTSYQSSMKDVPILQFEENCHRRAFKQVINIHSELAVTNQRHWQRTSAGHASVCVTLCKSCYSTVTFSLLKQAVRCSRIYGYTGKPKKFLDQKSLLQISV